MRQNLVIVLLSVCCTLLAVNLYVSVSGQNVREASGQATATPTSQVALATVQGTSNDPWCYLYDVGTQRLAVYKTGNQGIEIKGLRQLTWDLQITNELNPKLAQLGRVPPADIRKALDKASADGK